VFTSKYSWKTSETTLILLALCNNPDRAFDFKQVGFESQYMRLWNFDLGLNKITYIPRCPGLILLNPVHEFELLAN
jgi:hypothetical protein